MPFYGSSDMLYVWEKPLAWLLDPPQPNCLPVWPNFVFCSQVDPVVDPSCPWLFHFSPLPLRLPLPGVPGPTLQTLSQLSVLRRVSFMKTSQSMLMTVGRIIHLFPSPTTCWGISWLFIFISILLVYLQPNWTFQRQGQWLFLFLFFCL